MCKEQNPKFTCSFLKIEAEITSLQATWLQRGLNGQARKDVLTAECETVPVLLCARVLLVQDSTLAWLQLLLEKCHGRTLNPSKFESEHF